jgi:phage-related protein
VEVVINGKDNTGSAFGSAQSGLAKIGQIAMGILTSQVFTKLAQGVANFAGGVITEAREASLGQAQLNAVLKSTGGVAGVTAEQVNKLANSLQYQSKFTDDAILAGENMLLTFTNIGKDVFPTATQTVLDMSAALGQDATQSAMQLGKALNDPIGGVTALRRVGVQLTDEQEKQVKAFMAVNDIAGAQKIILGELGREFGGSAAAQVTAWDNVKKHVQDMQQTLGEALLPTIDKAGQVMNDVLANPKVQQALSDLTKWLGDNLPKALDTVIGVFGKFGTAGDGIMKFIQPFIPALRSIMSTFDAMKPTITAVGVVLFDKLKKTGDELAARVFPFLVAQVKKFSLWFAQNRPLIENFIIVVGKAFAWLANAVAKFWTVVEPILGGLFNIILGLAKLIMQVATGDWAGAWETMDLIVQQTITAMGDALVAGLDWIAGLMGGSLAGIKAQWTSNWNAFKLILTQVWNIIKTTVNNGLNAIKAYFSQAWANVISGVRSFGAGLVSAIVGSINSAISGASGALNGFISLGSKIITYIITGLNNAKNSLLDYLKGIISGLVSGLLGGGFSGGTGGIGNIGGGSDNDPSTPWASGTPGWMTVPSGYPNDSYPIRVQSGEEFAVRQKGEKWGGSSTTRNNYFNAHITIYSGKANRGNAMRGLT